MYPDRVSALLGASTVSQARHTRRIHVNKCPHCGSWHVQRKEFS